MQFAFDGEKCDDPAPAFVSTTARDPLTDNDDEHPAEVDGKSDESIFSDV
jgi:hypothetical protein